MSPEVKVIVWLEIELAWNDVEVQHINHYDTEAIFISKRKLVSNVDSLLELLTRAMIETTMIRIIFWI